VVSSAPEKLIERYPLALPPSVRFHRSGFNTAYPRVGQPVFGQDHGGFEFPFQNHPPFVGTGRLKTGSVTYRVIVSATWTEPFGGVLTQRWKTCPFWGAQHPIWYSYTMRVLVIVAGFPIKRSGPSVVTNAFWGKFCPVMKK